MLKRMICFIGVVGLWAACGSDGGTAGPPHSGVEEAKLISDLTGTERQTVCTWVTLQLDIDAGKTIRCDGEDVTITQALLDEFVGDIVIYCPQYLSAVDETCPVTVGQVETCMKKAIGKINSDPCKAEDFDAVIEEESSCEPFLDCLPPIED